MCYGPRAFGGIAAPHEKFSMALQSRVFPRSIGAYQPISLLLVKRISPVPCVLICYIIQAILLHLQTRVIICIIIIPRGLWY